MQRYSMSMKTNTVIGRWSMPTIGDRALVAYMLFRHAWRCNFMLPKRRFWKAEQTFQYAFSKHFSTFCRPNPVLNLEKCFENAF
jgi:hypothetical protein